MTRLAVVLAAGRGTRMGRLTDDTPKPMLEVAEKSMLARLLEGLADAGIERAAVITGYLAAQLEEHAQTVRGPALEFIRQDEPYRLELASVKSSETAASSLFAGVKRVRGHLESDARLCDSLVVYGGSEAQRRSDTDLVPWAEVDQHSWMG